MMCVLGAMRVHVRLRICSAHAGVAVFAVASVRQAPQWLRARAPSGKLNCLYSRSAERVAVYRAYDCDGAFGGVFIK